MRSSLSLCGLLALLSYLLRLRPMFTIRPDDGMRRYHSIRVPLTSSFPLYAQTTDVKDIGYGELYRHDHDVLQAIDPAPCLLQ